MNFYEHRFYELQKEKLNNQTISRNNLRKPKTNYYRNFTRITITNIK